MHRPLLLLPLLAVALAACPGTVETAEVAYGAVAEFHARYQAEDFDRIWLSSHPSFKASTGHTVFVTRMETMRRALGPFEGADPRGLQVGTTNGRRRVTVTVRARFERGEALERFTFSVFGRSALLAAYDVRLEGTSQEEGAAPAGLPGTPPGAAEAGAAEDGPAAEAGAGR